MSVGEKGGENERGNQSIHGEPVGGASIDAAPNGGVQRREDGDLSTGSSAERVRPYARPTEGEIGSAWGDLYRPPKDAATDAHRTPSRPRRWLTDGVLLAVAPLVGFGLSFLRERAYLARFGIPEWVIRPDAAITAEAILPFVGLVVFTYFAITVFTYEGTYFVLAVAAVVHLVVDLLRGERIAAAEWVLTTLVAVVALVFFWAARRARRYLTRDRGPEPALAAAEAPAAEAPAAEVVPRRPKGKGERALLTGLKEFIVDPGAHVESINRILGAAALPIVVCSAAAIAFTTVATWSGQYAAEVRQQYTTSQLTLGQPHQIAIVRRYGSEVVGVLLDGKGRMCYGAFVLLDADRDLPHALLQSQWFNAPAAPSHAKPLATDNCPTSTTAPAPAHAATGSVRDSSVERGAPSRGMALWRGTAGSLR